MMKAVYTSAFNWSSDPKMGGQIEKRDIPLRPISLDDEIWQHTKFVWAHTQKVGASYMMFLRLLLKWQMHYVQRLESNLSFQIDFTMILARAKCKTFFFQDTHCNRLENVEYVDSQPLVF